MEIVLLLLLIVGFLILWGMIAMEFQKIAAMKGHDNSKYFWWTFLLGPVGMMMVMKMDMPAKRTIRMERGMRACWMVLSTKLILP